LIKNPQIKLLNITAEEQVLLEEYYKEKEKNDKKRGKKRRKVERKEVQKKRKKEKNIKNPVVNSNTVKEPDVGIKGLTVLGKIEIQSKVEPDFYQRLIAEKEKSLKLAKELAKDREKELKEIKEQKKRLRNIYKFKLR